MELNYYLHLLKKSYIGILLSLLLVSGMVVAFLEFIAADRYECSANIWVVLTGKNHGAYTQKSVLATNQLFKDIRQLITDNRFYSEKISSILKSSNKLHPDELTVNNVYLIFEPDKSSRTFRIGIGCSDPDTAYRIMGQLLPFILADLKAKLNLTDLAIIDGFTKPAASSRPSLPGAVMIAALMMLILDLLVIILADIFRKEERNGNSLLGRSEQI